MRHTVLADQLGLLIAAIIGGLAGGYVIYLPVAALSKTITALPNTWLEVGVWIGCTLLLALVGGINGLVREEQERSKRRGPYIGPPY